MCVYVSCVCAHPCAYMYPGRVYIYVHVYAFRVCVYFICLLCVFVRIFTPACIGILCVMYSWVFLVVASSSLLLLWFYPQYWFIDLLIYCFIATLVYCFQWFLLAIIGFQKPPKFAVPCVFCCLPYNYDLSFPKMRNSRDFKPYFSFLL